MILDYDQIYLLIEQKKLLKKVFSYTILGFTKSDSGPLDKLLHKEPFQKFQVHFIARKPITL